MDSIPVLDLDHFVRGSQSDRIRFVDDLGSIYREIGFVSIKNHLLQKATEENLYSAVKEFFALPDELKIMYEEPVLKGQRGYIPKLKEHAKGSVTPDLKEFFHIGQEEEQGKPIPGSYPLNIWPKEVPGLQEYGLMAYRQLELTGIELLRAIALFLDLPVHYFDEYVRTGNSILRPIHYFPIHNPGDFPDGAVRAAEHTDINLITLLMGASAEGLQVLRRDGKWIAITALPGQLVVNVGDMLSRLTNNKLKSTVHRVVNPVGPALVQPRYSIPFFMHPVSEMKLNCLSSCVDAGNPKAFEDITAGDFLDQRLSEIGF